ncbi:MAG: efflux RND transporter periplasmic adaptor subunit [Betaproteobacteria bacterium]|jgi:HlyD family secretion protein|nr:efflux RND transporter periplasmic adaptor subunit [Betaproteobacteria bacterium]
MAAAAQPDITKLRIDRSGAPVRASRRRKSLWLGGAVVAALAGGAWYAAQPHPVTVQATTIVTSYPSQQYVVLNATGYVVAQRKAAIASKATGRLEWLGVAEGSRVKSGEVIARLDNRDVVAQAQSAEAAVRAARAVLLQAQAEERDASAQLKRNQDLVARGFLAQASLDTAQMRADRAVAGIASANAAIAVAEANARNAQVAVDYTVIRAPFDGVIVAKAANVGDMVTPFSSAVDSKGAVVSMADMSTLEVEADVSESSLAKISVGQPCEITLDALPDARFRGRVSRMVPTVDRAKATVMTKVQFDAIDPRILPDMSAKVSFLTQEVTADQQKALLAVNPDALILRDAATSLLVIRDGRVAAVPIARGIRLGDLVAIAGAVQTGEKVVLKPPADLTPGTLVKIVQK